MTEALRDQNRVPVKLGVLDSNDSITVAITIDEATGRLRMTYGGTDGVKTLAGRDGNRVTTLVGVSNVDGETIVPIRVNSEGKILI